MTKITADNITDEQIRELIAASAVPLATALDAMGMRAWGLPSKKEQRIARARCAEILNARAASKAERGGAK
ncbi:MAG TPA: hypothetical protein VIV58_23410 [Kofleriaceae bacterium]